jgi:hypothetical protein
MSKLVAEYLQHPLSASANIALLDDGNVGGVLGATLGSKLDVAGGKILQIVRATDSTTRNTTSTSLVDVTGMSVTISPQKSDSSLLIIADYEADIRRTGAGGCYSFWVITDSSNNALSGAENIQIGETATATQQLNIPTTVFAFVNPATTSPVTYKLRFRSENAAVTTTTRNGQRTGEMYAIEVSA